MKHVSDQEYSTVNALPAKERYGHFVAQVADWKQVWSLRTASGWVLVGDADGTECVPVWPHSRYARAFAEGPWEGAEPAAISVEVWVERWTKGITRDGRLVAVFPTPGNQGIVVSAERLCDDLRDQLDGYE
jgi:hypothetical protein